MEEELRNYMASSEIKCWSVFVQWVKKRGMHRTRVDLSIALNDQTCGTLLSQILYWNLPGKNGKTKLRVKIDGELWLAKRRTDWFSEIGISEKQYDTAIRKLRAKKIVETTKRRFNGSPTIHIKLNKVEMMSKISPFVEMLRIALFENTKNLNENVSLESDLNTPKGKIHFYQSGDSILLNGVKYNRDYKHRLQTNNVETKVSTTSFSSDGSLRSPSSEKENILNENSLGHEEGSRPLETLKLRKHALKKESDGIRSYGPSTKQSLDQQTDVQNSLGHENVDGPIDNSNLEVGTFGPSSNITLDPSNADAAPKSQADLIRGKMKGFAPPPAKPKPEYKAPKKVQMYLDVWNNSKLRAHKDPKTKTYKEACRAISKLIRGVFFTEGMGADYYIGKKITIEQFTSFVKNLELAVTSPSHLPAQQGVKNTYKNLGLVGALFNPFNQNGNRSLFAYYVTNPPKKIEPKGFDESKYAPLELRAMEILKEKIQQGLKISCSNGDMKHIAKCVRFTLPKFFAGVNYKVDSPTYQRYFMNVVKTAELWAEMLTEWYRNMPDTPNIGILNSDLTLKKAVPYMNDRFWLDRYSRNRPHHHAVTA